jgi:hypothetical protein
MSSELDDAMRRHPAGRDRRGSRTISAGASLGICPWCLEQSSREDVPTDIPRAWRGPDPFGDTQSPIPFLAIENQGIDHVRSESKSLAVIRAVIYLCLVAGCILGTIAATIAAAVCVLFQ